MENKKNSLKKTLLEIINFLNQNFIDYALIGDIAYSVLYEPRATLDIDFIIDVKDISEFIKTLKNNEKFLIVHNELMKFQNAKIERTIYENKIIVDFLIADNEFKKNVLSRKKSIKVDNEIIYIVTIEDLILLKLLSKREQDYLDIKNLLKIDQIDLNYIKYWINKLNVNFKFDI